MNTKNKPVHDIRLGAIKAAIWANSTPKGIRHSVTLTRLYKDGAFTVRTSRSASPSRFPRGRLCLASGWHNARSGPRTAIGCLGLKRQAVEDLAHGWCLYRCQATVLMSIFEINSKKNFGSPFGVSEADRFVGQEKTKPLSTSPHEDLQLLRPRPQHRFGHPLCSGHSQFPER